VDSYLPCVAVAHPPSWGSGSVASFDDTFFSDGYSAASDGTRTNTSSFYSTTSLTPTRTCLGSGTLTGLRMASAISSGESDTKVVSLSSSGTRTDSASMLEDSYGSVTPTSSSTSLSRTHEIRRRSRSSRTYSSSYPSYIDDSSDKEIWVIHLWHFFKNKIIIHMSLQIVEA
jgi:hypothetical protein